MFTRKSISEALDDESEEFYLGFETRPAERLGRYNQEQQASIIEYTYAGREKAKRALSPTSIERKAKEIMEKTPEFPTKKALK